MSWGLPDAFLIRQKLVATAIHLLLSITAVGALLLFVTQVWYPGFLFQTDGGWQGLRIVIFVDLVLGPLLTFIAFQRGKPGLAVDLLVIGLLQVVALVGGGWIVYAERPLALVFHEGRFYSITADDYLDVGQPVPDMSSLRTRLPDYLVLAPPESALEQSPVRAALLARQQLIYTYVPWMQKAATHLDEIHTAAIAPEELAQTDAERAVLKDWLASNRRTVETIAFLPYSSRFRIVYLAMDLESGKLLGALNINSR